MYMAQYYGCWMIVHVCVPKVSISCKLWKHPPYAFYVCISEVSFNSRNTEVQIYLTQI